MVRPATSPLSEALQVESFASSALECAVAETMGRRKEHQDAHAVSCTERGGDLWVLDGHRGASASAFGAAELPKEIGQAAGKGRLPSDGSIHQSFRAIDNRLRKHLKESTKAVIAGSTVIGALVAQQGDGSFSAKVINCGDSRAIIIRDPDDAGTADASPTMLQTVDHKPDHPIERARVLAAGGTVSKGRCPRVDGRLAVSRSLGDFDYKSDKGLHAAQQKVSCEPDIYHVSHLKPGSLLLLACDGVWDVMTSDGVANMVREALKTRPEASLSDIAKSVVCESYERGSCDNLTVLLARLVGGRGDGVAKAKATPSTA